MTADEEKADQTAHETAAEKSENTVPDEVDVSETTESADIPTDDFTDDFTDDTTATTARRGLDWPRILAFGVLPTVALVLALAAGALKYVDYAAHEAQRAATGSVAAATDGTVAILSYTAEGAQQQLNDARNRLSGGFADQYGELISTVVIPGAKQKQISATATVPAAASVSANPNHAVVLVFVNQRVTVGTDAPTDTASSVRVTLDESDGRWLISGFDPV